uniref:Ribonuclease S-7 n=3 Tax=Nicotiana alata TaxID=4087 RepID=RNS7_NICAL|nr:RecName: Full=Ribonuclease S-7; AltName: Full=S7-RNase; AltName: Full=Stylar glycoprotein 7; Flags: Precursor [Nicotiana alata]AAA87898.1 S7-RNase [Nicotiana alata]
MLNSPLTSVLFVLLFVLSPIYGAFEYMQLVLQWPTAFCHTTPCKRIPNNFTIHGLWPDNVSTTLNYCAAKENFKNIEDDTKKDDLYKRWPDLTTAETYCKQHQNFWRHEYNKHGKCCSESYNREQYFDLAMALKDKFDLLSSLRNHGIIPGRGMKYTVQKINSTIKKITQGYPNLSCTKGIMELVEIGICFDSMVKNVINCPHPKTCKPTGSNEIKFP